MAKLKELEKYSLFHDEALSQKETKQRIHKQGRLLFKDITVMCEVVDKEQARVNEPGRKSYRKQRKIEQGHLTFEDKQEMLYLDYGRMKPLRTLDRVDPDSPYLCPTPMDNTKGKEAYKSTEDKINVKHREQGGGTHSQKEVGARVPVVYQGVPNLETNPYGFQVGYNNIHQQSLEKKAFKGLPVGCHGFGSTFSEKISYASMGGGLGYSYDLYTQAEEKTHFTPGSFHALEQTIKGLGKNDEVNNIKAAVPATMIYYQRMPKSSFEDPLPNTSEGGGTVVSWQRCEEKLHHYGRHLLNHVVQPEITEAYTFKKLALLKACIDKETPALETLLKPQDTDRKAPLGAETKKKVKASRDDLKTYITQLLNLKADSVTFDKELSTRYQENKKSLQRIFRQLLWLEGKEDYLAEQKQKAQNIYNCGMQQGWKKNTEAGLFWNKETDALVYQAEEFFRYEPVLGAFGVNKFKKQSAENIEGENPQTLLEALGVEKKASNVWRGGNPTVEKEVSMQHWLNMGTRKAYSTHKGLAYSESLNERFAELNGSIYSMGTQQKLGTGRSPEMYNHTVFKINSIGNLELMKKDSVFAYKKQAHIRQQKAILKKGLPGIFNMQGQELETLAGYQKLLADFTRRTAHRKPILKNISKKPTEAGTVTPTLGPYQPNLKGYNTQQRQYPQHLQDFYLSRKQLPNPKGKLSSKITALKRLQSMDVAYMKCKGNYLYHSILK